ncbi:hypothetical protein [Streptomyces sp. NBC_00239]|uniref:hypothetical protein n=1 Tax=Streptomyces sp. NBC_00239 TaxID=2903640 RepID=UPI002E2A9BFA|nr:hypothetical protein [Streptomyces sp. NBC_00239]
MKRQTLGRYVCAVKALVPPATRLLLLRAAGVVDLDLWEHVMQVPVLRCGLETHDGPHWTLLYEAADSTCCWLRWEDGSPTGRVAALPECPASLDASTPCELFRMHPGGHTWEVTDPDDELWNAVMPVFCEMYGAGHRGPVKRAEDVDADLD